MFHQRTNGNYISPLDDPRGFKKRNRWAREASKRSPLIALLLLVSLGGSVVWHTTQVWSLRGQLKAQLTGHENLKHELLAQTRAADSTREMAVMRQRHLDQMRTELEAVRGKLRTAEEEGTRMRALISHNNNQVGELHAQVQNLQALQTAGASCRADLDLSRGRAEQLQRSLSDKEFMFAERERQVGELQRQLAEAQARTPGAVPSNVPPVPLLRPGATDPRRGVQQVPDAAAMPAVPDVGGGGGGGGGGISAEAHAGFAHVAQMLTDQGILDPAGQGHLTALLVQFFESRMADLIGAEFHDPSAAPKAPMHEELVARLAEQGIYSTKGAEHLHTTVQHMVDAIGHATGVPPSASSAIEAAAMVGRANTGGAAPPAEAHAGHQTGGRKDLGGGEGAQPVQVQDPGYAGAVPAAQQAKHPGYDHGGFPGWQHDSHPAAAGVQDPHLAGYDVHPDILAARHAFAGPPPDATRHHKPDAAGFIY